MFGHSRNQLFVSKATYVGAVQQGVEAFDIVVINGGTQDIENGKLPVVLHHKMGILPMKTTNNLDIHGPLCPGGQQCVRFSIESGVGMPRITSISVKNARFKRTPEGWTCRP